MLGCLGFYQPRFKASLKRRPKRNLSRGFGTGARGSLSKPSKSPGPGTYDLFRVGDEDWERVGVEGWGWCQVAKKGLDIWKKRNEKLQYCQMKLEDSGT